MSVITPISESGRDCLENIFATIVNAYGKNKPLLFCNAWSFDYRQRENSFTGNDIIVDWGDLVNNMKTYNGINVEYVGVADPYEALNIISQRVKKDECVAFVISLNYCYWHSFSDLHEDNKHMLIAYDINENNELMCIDCQPACDGIRLATNDFINGFLGKICLFEKVEPQLFLAEDIIYNALNKFCESNYFDDTFIALDEFAKNILFIDYENECSGKEEYDFWKSSFFHNVKSLSMGRKKFSECLEYLLVSYQHESKGVIIDMFDKLSNQWLLISSIYMKCRLTNNFNKAYQVIPKLINEINAMEKNCYNYLLDIYKMIKGMELGN